MTNAFYRTVLFCLLICIWHEPTFAQILDDSTKQIYGPQSTTYVLEEDFLQNNYHKVVTDSSVTFMTGINRIDTVLNGIQNFNRLYDGKNVHQNLGNYLSPSQSVYYEHPLEIGKRLGFQSFDQFVIDPMKVKYYDTKSPYSQIRYIQGTKGQQGIKVDFSRNIIRNWNIGFDIRRETSRKILGVTNPGGATADKKPQSGDYMFAFHTRYYSKNERYQIMANMTHAHRTYFDNGGIKPKNPMSLKDSIFGYELSQTYLSQARSIDRRVNYHLYQEYALTDKKSIQIYHSSDYQKRTIRFDDLLVSGATPNGDTTFYKQILRNLDEKFLFTKALVSDRTDYKLLENRVGIKGIAGNVNYRLYYRHKDFQYIQNSYANDSVPFHNRVDSMPVNSTFQENFIGGTFQYLIPEKIYALLDGEYYLGNDYRYRLEVGNNIFKGGYSKILYSPTLLQLQYRGNIYNWNNYKTDHAGFISTLADKIYAEGFLNFRNLHINPGVNYEIIRNYIYFDTLARPAQNPNSINILSIDLSLKFSVWRLHFETYNRYTQINDTSTYRAPKLFNRNRIYFQSDLFKRAAVIQFGFDTYWRSTYYANKYIPVTQQFYLNSNFEVRNYFLVDLFLNVEIKRASFFLKGSHINQLFNQTGGYYATPYYSGLPFSFDFGVRWQFFD